MSGPFLVIGVGGIGIRVAFGGAWVSFLGWDGVMVWGGLFLLVLVWLWDLIGWFDHRSCYRLLSALCRWMSVVGICKIIWNDVDW